jgi:hypothetical protein
MTSSKPAAVVGGKWVLVDEKSSTEIKAAVPELKKSALQITGMVPGVGTVVKGKRGKGGISLPPVIDGTIHCHHTFRYLSTDATATTITLDSIASALGGIVHTNTTTKRPWCSSFRVKGLTIWPSPVAGTESRTRITWAYTGDRVPDMSCVDMLPGGVTQTVAQHFKPPKNSLAGMWNQDSSATLITSTIPVDSVIDLHIEFTLSNKALWGDQTIGASTVGLVVYGALDSNGYYTFQI